MATYKIVRYFTTGPKRVQATGLTLEQAQAHCGRSGSRKAGKWFDGFTKEI